MSEIVAISVVWAYMLGFLVLTAIATRRSGNSVWLFGVGKEPQAIPAMLFRVSFVLGAALPPLTAWAFSSEPPWPLRTWSLVGGVDVAGVLLAIGGASAALYAQHYMGSSWRIGAADGHVGRIVDGGPFSVSRNPVFVGQIALFGGLWLVFPSAAQLLLTVALVVATVLQVRIEERILERSLDGAYLAYKRQVRRWV